MGRLFLDWGGPTVRVGLAQLCQNTYLPLVLQFRGRCLTLLVISNSPKGLGMPFSHFQAAI